MSMIGSGIGLLAGLGNDTAPTVTPYQKQVDSNLATQTALQPQLLNTESTWAPQYANASAEAALQRTADLSPQVAQTLAAYNPQTAGLLNTLSQQATQQMSYNGGLDPATQRLLQQNIRGSQAARGMGYGTGDQAQEAYYVTQTQEQRRAANQQFGSQVASQAQNFYGDPFSRVAGLQTQSAPMVNPESAYAADIYNTQFNANAAANIATANNQAALVASGNSGASSMAGSGMAAMG
nr:hypothetical protein [uncultured Rhodopila sp.]